MSLLLQLLANGCIDGLLFALLACGFGLVYRAAQVFHIAFAGLFLLAPYLAFWMEKYAQTPIWVAIPTAVLAAGVVGWLMERCFYRHFRARGSSAGAVMVASLGLLIIIENSLALAFGDEVKSLTRPGLHGVHWGPLRFTGIQLLQGAAGACALVAFIQWARRSRSYRFIQAMADEPDLLPVLGHNPDPYRALVFLISGLLGGLSACLIALDVGIDPHMGMTYLLIAAVAVLAGGTDRMKGWIIGGFLLALVQSAVMWGLSSRWRDLFTFATLVAVLIFRPRGVLGVRQRVEESPSAR